jgi:hypothetical protein
VIGLVLAFSYATAEPSRVTSPPDPVQSLITEHRCFPSPGQIPSGAVVTLPGQRPRLVPADAGFGIWLGPDGEQDTGDEREGVLHAFCP